MVLTHKARTRSEVNDHGDKRKRLHAGDEVKDAAADDKQVADKEGGRKAPSSNRREGSRRNVRFLPDEEQEEELSPGGSARQRLRAPRIAVALSHSAHRRHEGDDEDGEEREGGRERGAAFWYTTRALDCGCSLAPRVKFAKKRRKSRIFV